jgi:hypothetical protein
MTIWKNIYDTCKVRVHLELSDVIFANKGTMYIKDLSKIRSYDVNKDDIVIFHFEIKDKNYVTQLVNTNNMMKKCKILYDLEPLLPDWWSDIEFPPLKS